METHEREELTRQLERQMDEMTARVKGVPEEELDEILDEAMRHVRPSYRRSE
jgi:hypothetical protein